MWIGKDASFAEYLMYIVHIPTLLFCFIIRCIFIYLSYPIILGKARARGSPVLLDSRLVSL